MGTEIGPWGRGPTPKKFPELLEAAGGKAPEKESEPRAAAALGRGRDPPRLARTHGREAGASADSRTGGRRATLHGAGGVHGGGRLLRSVPGAAPGAQAGARPAPRRPPGPLDVEEHLRLARAQPAVRGGGAALDVPVLPSGLGFRPRLPPRDGRPGVSVGRLLPGRCGGSPVESALGPIVAPALSPRAGSGLPECGCDAGKLPEHLRGASAVGGELGLPALAEAASAGRPAVLPALLPGQLGHAGHPAGLPPAALGMDQPAAAPAPPPLPPPLHCALGSRAARHHHHEHEVTHRPAHQWPLGPSLAHKEGDQKHRGTGEGGLRQASTQRGHLLQAAGLAQTCDLGDRRLRSGRSTGFNPLGPRCTRCRGFLSPGVRGAEAGLGPMLLGGEPRCWC